MVMYNTFLKTLLSELPLYVFDVGFFTIWYSPKLDEPYDLIGRPNTLNYVLIFLLIVSVASIVVPMIRKKSKEI